MNTSKKTTAESLVPIPTLKDLQAGFKQRLMQGSGTIQDYISSDGALTASIRLNIYANAYVARLVEALGKDYEALAELLGEEDFYELCQAYILRYPSTYSSLRWFGQNLANFMRQTPPYDTQQHMIELAGFEWSLLSAFSASNCESVTEQTMAQIAADQWPDLKLQFHPAVHLCPYQWNIIPLWQAMKQQHPMPAPEKLQQPQCCLIWRKNLQTQFRTLEFDEALLLPLAYRQATFGELCEFLAQQSDQRLAPQDLALRAATCLKTWINAGLITALGFADSQP